MKFDIAAAALMAFAGVSARRPVPPGQQPVDLHDTKALTTSSVLGKRLLSKAKVIQPANHNLRRVEDNNNNWNYGGYDNEYGLYDLATLYISYTGCSSYMAADQDGQGNNNNGGGGEQNNYNNYYNNDGMYMSNLVLFTICSADDCSTCSGEYAVDMQEFLDIYTEMKMQNDEYQCEYVREHCYCSNKNNNYNDYQAQAQAYDYNGDGRRKLEDQQNRWYNNNYYSSCLTTCYENAGLDNCMNQYYGGDEFELQEYLECSGTYEPAKHNEQESETIDVGLALLTPTTHALLHPS